MRKRVVLESPYRGEVAANKEYAYDCLSDSINRGEAPIASHLLYTQVLDDSIEDQREAGIQCGLAWIGQAELHVFYIDRGWSEGMIGALAYSNNIDIEFRTLNGGTVRIIKK